ncbi:MAG: shikimate dehydrogenase [Legionellaceae bacterium]|nr:shikimate dehydrogenase [Legionellaceae bacterium]
MSRLQFAVMGDPIKHSLSPEIHKLFAEQVGIDISYEKLLVGKDFFNEEVHNFFNKGGCGLNITLPHKQAAYALSDIRTNRCIAAKSANTLWHKDEKIFADNTDGLGLIADLKNYINLTNKKVLLLGAGGAARGVIGPLLGIGVKNLTIFNRTHQKAVHLQQDFMNKLLICDESSIKAEYDVIINATSASLEKEAGLNIPDKVIAKALFCYDLAYDLNKPTSFVERACQLGTKAQDGIGMLIEQAALSFQIWHKIMPKTRPI